MKYEMISHLHNEVYNSGDPWDHEDTDDFIYIRQSRSGSISFIVLDITSSRTGNGDDYDWDLCRLRLYENTIQPEQFDPFVMNNNIGFDESSIVFIDETITNKTRRSTVKQIITKAENIVVSKTNIPFSKDVEIALEPFNEIVENNKTTIEMSRRNND